VDARRLGGNTKQFREQRKRDGTAGGGIDPAMNEPNTIVTEAGQNSANGAHLPSSVM